MFIELITQCISKCMIIIFVWYIHIKETTERKFVMLLSTCFWLCFNQRQSEIWYHCASLWKMLWHFHVKNHYSQQKCQTQASFPQCNILSPNTRSNDKGSFMAQMTNTLSLMHSVLLMVVALRSSVFRWILNPNLGLTKKSDFFD